MNLPKEAVNEFLEIYQRKINENLSFDEAAIRAENFLKLMVLLTGNSEINNLNKNEKK